MDLNEKKKEVLAALTPILEDKIGASPANYVVMILSGMLDGVDANATAIEIADTLGKKLKVVLPDTGGQMIDRIIRTLKAQLMPDPVEPVPTPTPEPPAPVPTPTPTPSGIWKCSMFFPLGMCPNAGSATAWSGNQGVDSLLQYSGSHGQKWEDAFRVNGFKWIQKLGGDTALFISEFQLFNHIELQMYLCNRAHPDDGHHIGDKENFVKIAQTYGINHWIVSLFNDDNHYVPDNKHEEYIAQICGKAYEWASADLVAFMICLETNERFSVAETLKRVGWIKKCAPGKRILVGSAQPDFLKSVHAQDSAVEMWLETSHHPFALAKDNADKFLASVGGLMNVGKTWAGEYGRGSGEAAAYVSRRAIEMGCAGIGSWVGA